MSSDSFVVVSNFFRFKTRRRFNLCATESLCYQIYLVRELFMWPNIEKILLTMFLFLQLLLVCYLVLLCVKCACARVIVLMLVAYFLFLLFFLICIILWLFLLRIKMYYIMDAEKGFR